jgi:hypothetical protein
LTGYSNDTDKFFTFPANKIAKFSLLFAIYGNQEPAHALCS